MAALSQTSRPERVATRTELFFSLPSVALHEFPNDIFTNEDRRQGAVVLHVLCVSTPPVALSSGPEGRPGGGLGGGVQRGALRGVSPPVHIPGRGPVSPMEGDLQMYFLKNVFIEV